MMIANLRNDVDSDRIHFCLVESDDTQREKVACEIDIPYSTEFVVITVLQSSRGDIKLFYQNKGDQEKQEIPVEAWTVPEDTTNTEGLPDRSDIREIYNFPPEKFPKAFL